MLLALLLASGSGAPSFEVRTIRDAVHRGEPAALEGTKLVLRSAGGTVAVECGDMLSAIAVQTPLRGTTPSSLLELADGDLLYGSVESGKGDLLHFRGAGEDLLDVGVGNLRRWIHLGNAGSRPPETFAPATDGDRLYVATAGGLDHLDGTLSALDGDGFVFESALGKTRKTFAEAVALVLAPEAEPKPSTELLALVELGDGTRVTGRLAGLEEGSLTLVPNWTKGLRVRLDRIASIRFRNGRYVYLSELEPAEAVETPFFGGSDALRFPFQRDRSVGGGPLRCGGRTWSRGLGLHSRTVLRYALDGKYDRFRALAGIDDEVLSFAASGSALLRVAVDGKPAFESPPLRAGGEPVPLPEIDVRGAKDLRIEVDYGEDFHVGDRVDLLEPVLIRG